MRIALAVTPPETGISMHWQGCGDATPGQVQSCAEYDAIENPESPYGPGKPYGTVDAANGASSLSFTAIGDPELYLVLEGSLDNGNDETKLSSVPHTAQYDPEMTCVARLETDPIDPSTQGVPVVRALTQGELHDSIETALGSDCALHPILSTLAFPPIVCSDPGGEHSTASDNHVPEDKDGDGRRTEDDNCPHFPNTTQEDAGGNGIETADGDGDDCQCGDADALEGAVLSADVAKLREHLANPIPGVQGRCNVGGNPHCSIGDAVILKRALSQMSFDGDFVGRCEADLP